MIYRGPEIGFDLYPAADPRDGERVVRLTQHQKGTMARRERRGTGMGIVVLPGDSDDAALIDPKLGQYVRAERLYPLVELATSAAADDVVDTAAGHGLVVGDKVELVGLVGGTGLSTVPVYWVRTVPTSTSLTLATDRELTTQATFTTDITAGSIRKLKTQTGFFLEKGNYAALTGNNKRPLVLTGAGTLAYLRREIMWSHTYETWGNDPSEGGQPDVWQLFQGSPLFGGGDKAGAVLWRVIHEGLGYLNAPGYLARAALDDDKLETAIPAAVLTFDGFTDSAGNAWTAVSGNMTAQVLSETVLDVVLRVMQTGVEVVMDPDTFEVKAYNEGTLGTDRTGLGWGAGVVRFTDSTDGTVGTGNITTTARRAVTADVRRSAILAGGQNVYNKAVDATAPIPWHGGLRSDVVDVDALGVLADFEIKLRTDAGDVPRIRILPGDDEDEGLYRAGPGGHFDIYDVATLHSGSGTWHWDELAVDVSAIEWMLRDDEAGDVDTFVEFGSTYAPLDQAVSFGAPSTGAHTHPPNPRLCTDASAHLLLDLPNASLKASSIAASHDKEHANDGEDGTHWSATAASAPVAGSWWAADRGQPATARRYRILQVGAAFAATSIDLYGSNDPDAWSWLTDEGGKLAEDAPAANGWTLIETLAAAAGDTSGALTAPATYRYWLIHAVAGGASDLDLYDFDLIGGGDPPPQAIGANGEASHGTCTCAARGCHIHPHSDLSDHDDETHHHASSVKFTPTGTIAADDVQEAVAEVASEAVQKSSFTAAGDILRGTGAGTFAVVKNNLAGTTAPTVNDDSGDGYSVGSRWLDTTNDKEYVCLDATATAAVWKETTAAGGSGTLSDDTPLVESGTGSAGTSDEASRSDHVHPADGGGGGGSGPSWTQDVDEDGTSFAAWVANAGTWASDGTNIRKTNSPTGAHERARYDTKLALGFGVIAECEIRLPTAGQGSGANVQASLNLGYDGAAGQGGLAVTLELGSTGVGVQVERGQVAITKKWTTAIALDTWHKIRLVTVGPWVSIYFNGSLIGTTWVDLAQGTADYLGLLTFNAIADFRNIKLWTLSGGAPA